MAFPVTDAFKKRVLESHQVKTKIEVFDPITDEVLLELTDITEGEVDEDRLNDNRRKGKFTAVDATGGSLTPVTADDILAPYGNQWRPFRGIVLQDGTIEWIPQGVFEISDNTIIDSGDNFSMQVAGDDRSAWLQRTGFHRTLTVPAATTIADAAAQILNWVGYPWDFAFGGSSGEMMVAQQVYNIGDDPWKALQVLFTTCGCNVFHDETGVLVCRDLFDYTAIDPDWEIKDGVDGNLLSVQRQMSRSSDFANWYVVTGETPSNGTTIAYGEAFDDDPNSPTYVFGKFGIVLKHVQSTTALTNAEAQMQAQHLLDEGKGQSEQIVADILPNPAMQVDDLILFTREQAGLSEVRIVLDQIAHPLIATRGGNAISRRLVSS